MTLNPFATVAEKIDPSPKVSDEVKTTTCYMPFLLTALTLALVQPVAGTAAALAALSAILGVLIERWLFFAEAKHAVTLFYGQSTA